jgi:4-hydroxy-tetrahydrodipicolinate synthase
MTKFRSDPATITGSIAPVVTPFAQDGALDLDSLRGLVRWQIESGSHGIELLCLPLLALGGTGFVSAVANLAPRAVSRTYELWTAGEQEAARELHYALHPLVDLLFVETNPAPAKWVLHQEGRLASPHVRPPLITPTETGLVKIRELLAKGTELLGADR